MPEGVKATRRYDSTRRREQAAATRREILEAAQRLFERDGYVATTMAAIAAEAGVALKTVYLAFETKSGAAARALAPAPARRRGRRPGRRAPVVPRRHRRARPRAPAAAQRAQLRAGQAARRERSCASCATRPAPTPTSPRCGSRIQDDFLANQRAVVDTHRRQGRARPRPRRRARRRHPLDAQPPRRLAPAGRRARLDARGVRAVVRRHGVRPAARALRLLSRRAPAAAPAA